MSSKMYSAGDAVVLVPEIIDNGAMTHLDTSSNNLTRGKWTNALLDNDRDDSSNYETNMAGVIALANAIPDMGALSVANVMGNKIGKEQFAKLQEIMRAKPSLVSLCGIADGATEADISGLKMGADGAAILASELLDKGALPSLNLAGTGLGEMVLPVGWKQTNHTEWTHSDGKRVAENPGKSEGAIDIANVEGDDGPQSCVE
jgi:hypothetical protein